jgi:hypothetical protein
MMRPAMWILAAALFLGGCASPEPRSSATADRAGMCAMCGASVTPGYFMESTDKAIGPGQGF